MAEGGQEDELHKKEMLRMAVYAVLNHSMTQPYASGFFEVNLRTLQDNVKAARKEMTPNEDGTYGEVTTVKDFKGPDPSLSRELEHKIRVFIEDCYFMGIPRCKGKLAQDIQEYLRRYNIQVENFENQKPGRHYLEKYRHDQNGRRTQLLTAKKVKDFHKSEVTLDSWHGDVKTYVMQVDEELIQERSMIFIIQSQMFVTYTEPSRNISVIVVYDGDGTLIQWYFVTDGTVLTDDMMISGEHDVMFLKTPSGHINSTIVRIVMITLKRYLKQRNKTGFVLMLMDMFIAENFDFFVWEYCKENRFLTIAIPKCLCDSLRVMNIGPMCRYASFMLFIMKTRFIDMEVEMNEVNFVYMHKGVVTQVISQRAITKMLSMLKISNLVRKNVRANLEQNIPDDNLPEPSTSEDVPPVMKKRRPRKKKVSNKAKTDKQADQDKDNQPVVQTQQTPMRSDQCTMSTQTDQDFEYFLEMGPKEYEEYIAYQHLQLSHQHLVNTIVPQDFEDYEKDK